MNAILTFPGLPAPAHSEARAVERHVVIRPRQARGLHVRRPRDGSVKLQERNVVLLEPHVTGVWRQFLDTDYPAGRFLFGAIRRAN